MCKGGRGRPAAHVGFAETAADLGFLGFGNNYNATFEGNVAILPWDKVLMAYEFRQKTDDYPATDHSVDGHVMSLRKKLGSHAHLIETVRRAGYRRRAF
jgi:hypothetical protein